MDEMIFVHDTGWLYTRDWIIDLSYRQGPWDNEWSEYHDEWSDYIKRYAESLNIQGWECDPLWGLVKKRTYDDGIVIMIRRIRGSARVLVFASSEALWIKFILEFRGS